MHFLAHMATGVNYVSDESTGLPLYHRKTNGCNGDKH